MAEENRLPSLTVAQCARVFGASIDEVATCASTAGSLDLRYQPIIGRERDELILRILRQIDSADLQIAGEERRPAWESGWRENLQEFTASEFNVEKLVPKYFKRKVPVRFMGDYILPHDPDFVLALTGLFRAWLFRKYLGDFESIYEFGCGPASHLAYLAEVFPDKRLYGLDWASASQEIIRLLALHHGWSIQGRNFDFFNPDRSFHLESGSAVFTFGSLEQVGDRYGAFMDYLLAEKPALCINVECMAEFYDPELLVDYLALKYHKRRGYLEGWLTRLRELERDGQIAIIAAHHQQFGNLFDDSHSYVIWKPIL